ncbi:hypothetical protein HKX48_004677 [Thoreauomyces humboldtii]|nr:hypothetical protein HKX48_004677 [Thoreauomyces humboldtii]
MAHRPLTPAVKLAPLLETARVSEYDKLDDGKTWFKLTVFPRIITPPQQKLNYVYPSPPATPSRQNSSGSASQPFPPQPQQPRPYVVWRRYEHFCEFHSALLVQTQRDNRDNAADAAALKKLPALPKSRFFVTRAVCDSRVVTLDQYVRLLLAMDQRVTRNILVAEFFGVWPRDAEEDGSDAMLVRGEPPQSELPPQRPQQRSDNKERQEYGRPLPTPPHHQAMALRPRDPSHNTNKVRPEEVSPVVHISFKQRMAEMASVPSAAEEDDIPLDEPWLRPVEEKRRSRMIDAGALGRFSLGPGLNTLLRDGTTGTSAQDFFAGPASSSRPPTVPELDESDVPLPKKMTVRHNSVSRSDAPAARHNYTSVHSPVSPGLASPNLQLSQPNEEPPRPALEHRTHSEPTLQKFPGPAINIPRRSFSRNWATQPPSPSASTENAVAAPAVPAVPSSPGRSNPAHVAAGNSYFPQRPSPLSTTPVTGADTLSYSAPAPESPQGEFILPRPEQVEPLAKMIRTPTSPLFSHAELEHLPVIMNPARRPTLIRNNTDNPSGSEVPQVPPPGSSRGRPARSASNDDNLPYRPSAAASAADLRGTDTMPRSSPSTPMRRTPTPTFGQVDGSAHESPRPAGLQRQPTVTTTWADLRTFTLSRHQSTPSLDRPVNEIPAPPTSAAPQPPASAPVNGTLVHPDLLTVAAAVPTSLHRTLTDPYLLTRRQTPSPTRDFPADLPPPQRPSAPVRKPSLLDRARTQMRRSPSPPPTESELASIPPWSRPAGSVPSLNRSQSTSRKAPGSAPLLGRSNSVKNGIIYKGAPPPSAPLARARTFVPHNVHQRSRDDSMDRLPPRQKSAHQPFHAPRRANTLSSSASLPAHFIHLKAQYHGGPPGKPPVTILLKVSRSTQLGVVTGRLQEKFETILEDGVKVLGLTYEDDDGCRIDVADDEDWAVLCQAAEGKVVVGVRVDKARPSYDR